MKLISYAVLMFLFWLALSGHFSPLLLGLGLFSVLLTVFLAHRMKIIDREAFPLHLIIRMPGYLLYLLKEIWLANVDVIKRILSTKPDAISPQLFEVPLDEKTDLGRVIYANSITLTPGTVSVDVKQDRIVVHALSKDAAEGLAEGIMAKAVKEKVDDQ